MSVWEVLIVSSDDYASTTAWEKSVRVEGGTETDEKWSWNELKWFRRMEKERVKPDGERGTYWPERNTKSFSLAGLEQLWNITGGILLFVAHTSSMPHVSCCPFSDPKKGCQPPSSSSSESVI